MKKIAPPPPPPPAVPTPAVTNADYPDFPDPFLFKDESPGYLAAATNAVGAGESAQNRMPTIEATGTLASWDGTDDLLDGDPPSWLIGAGQDYAYWWAPAVWRSYSGDYVLYFTARHHSGKQCIGGATASDPEGPYEVTGSFEDTPVVCQLDWGGSIDPSVFVDPANGEPWLLWKSDGNCCGVQPYVWAQRLSDDGREVKGAPTGLIGVTQDWEFGPNAFTTVVEGPSMISVGGEYYLFYSGSFWLSASYAIGYAKCPPLWSNIPCTKPQTGPIMATGPNGLGPGGGEAFVDHSGFRWLAYHAWNPNLPVNYPGGQRRLHITALGFSDGVPSFGSAP